MRSVERIATGRSPAGVLRTDDGRLRLAWRLVAFLTITILCGLVVLAVSPRGTGSGSVALLMGALAAGWLMLASEGRAPGALGFHLSRESFSESLRGLVLGVSIGAVVVLLLAGFGGVRWTPDEGDVVAWMTGSVGAFVFLAIPAAAEEAFLRGYPLQALAEVWGKGGAIVATSIVFGLLHLGNPGSSILSTVNVAMAGVLLGVVYVKTMSLWWATGAHIGWNWALGFLADVPVSGLEMLDAPLYDGVMAGPAWLGGGAFGPEGSVLATLVMIASSLALWRGPWLRPGVTMSARPPLYAGAGWGHEGPVGHEGKDAK